MLVLDEHRLCLVMGLTLPTSMTDSSRRRHEVALVGTATVLPFSRGHRRIHRPFSRHSLKPEEPAGQAAQRVFPTTVPGLALSGHPGVSMTLRPPFFPSPQKITNWHICSPCPHCSTHVPRDPPQACLFPCLSSASSPSTLPRAAAAPGPISSATTVPTNILLPDFNVYGGQPAARQNQGRDSGHTNVVFTATWAPCQKGKPLASTSTRRQSASATQCSYHAGQNC